MKLIYICHPYTSDPVRNREEVTEICKRLLAKGVIPWAVHLYFHQILTETGDNRSYILDMDIAIAERCDEIWVYGTYASAGMVQEIQQLVDKKMKVLSGPVQEALLDAERSKELN